MFSYSVELEPPERLWAERKMSVCAGGEGK